jgi:CRISPR-associated endonuclease Csn1
MKILGLDPGSNSIGWSIRDIDDGDNILEQLEYYGVLRFEKGVGKDKSGEFSYAAKRTEFRSARRLYQVRKYRLWETLNVLIKNGYCPLNVEDLDKWRKYDKAKGLKRQYPVWAKEFDNWIKLDFNGDDKPDYSSPYELRTELAIKQLDFEEECNRYKLGRALYHIAQRRGFKSSKGETLKDLKENEELTDNLLQKSEEKVSKELQQFIKEKEKQGKIFPTIACAFYELEKEGNRIRNVYHAVRSQYEEEIKYIFDFQEQLSNDSDFYKDVHKAIFYKRPLRSQKGSVGKCTLEPTKSRCPISHPDFEFFRAWCVINNIKYRKNEDDEWQELPLNLKEELYQKEFLKEQNKAFKFEKIREWIEDKLKISLSNDKKTINYKDNTSIIGCPVTARMRNIFGEDWKKYEKCSSKERVNPKTGVKRNIKYTWEDIWHVCFSFEDKGNIIQFAKEELSLDDKNTKSFINLWLSCQQGYSMLSLKAIRNINVFLKKGLIYTNAVLLAKLPEIFSNAWNEHEKEITEELIALQNKVLAEKNKYIIVNDLIANYKSKELCEQFANKNYEYKLCDLDKKEVLEYCKESFGEKTWENKSTSEKQVFLAEIENLYQGFFKDKERKFYTLPNIGTELKEYLISKFRNIIDVEKVKKLYHPSAINIYHPSKKSNINFNGTLLSLKLLGSPNTGVFKNPMAMRMLHMLRKLINYLLKKGMIDETTRVVVETAKDLNDSNMRWAIETYQKRQELKNKAIEEAIKELMIKNNVLDIDIDKICILSDQGIAELDEYDLKHVDKKKKNEKEKLKFEIEKYKLWLEQGCRCIYTGKLISITDLLGDNPKFDIEHTLPRSKTLDDSVENKTICDSDYNRKVKVNHIPTELPNYEAEILPRLKPWFDKVNKLKDEVEFWRTKSKMASTKDYKDNAIRQRHLKEMELKHWKEKVEKFTIKEIKSSFTHRQLVDTRIISKYAVLYLKTVFSNVEVQKGNVTSTFRKIVNIQPIDEDKDRSKYFHHAVDATILTIIPSSAQRDKILSLFYDIEDKKQLGQDYSDVEKLLNIEIKKLKLGKGISFMPKQIEDNIIINYLSKDSALTQVKKRVRIRGKKVMLDNHHCKWMTGDSIRGGLHKDTLLGAIKYPIRDDHNNLQKQDGKFIYNQDNDKSILMVKRISISELQEKDIELDKEKTEYSGKIIDLNVREAIRQAIIKRKKEGQSFIEAIKSPIWMLDKYGNEKKFDKKNRPLSPIRHVRCQFAAGRGYLTKSKALIIKKQTYKSQKQLVNLRDRQYKEFYYAQSDTNYLCLLYEGEDKKGNLKRDFKFINYFEISEFIRSFNGEKKIKSSNDLFNEPEYTSNKDNIKLKAIIKVGTRVLMYDKSIEEINNLSVMDLNKRLFVVYKFNSTGSNHIYLQNHLEARQDSEIPSTEEFSSFNPKIYQARLTLVATSFNCLIEGIDFDITPIGEIIFKDRRM